MITRNALPILEYDDTSPEVIAPDHGWSGGRLPEKGLFAFLGDVVHLYAGQHGASVAETLVTVSHDIKVYVVHAEDEDICLVQSPIGAAAAAQVLDTLVCCGCRKVYCDECGAKKTFSKYKKCREVYCRLWKSGCKSISQLTVKDF